MSGKPREAVDLAVSVDDFSDEWFKELGGWVRRYAYRHHLPWDFSADCVQEQVLQSLEQTRSNRTQHPRARIIRVSKDSIVRAVRKEDGHYRSCPVSFDEHCHSRFDSQRSDESGPDDFEADSRAAHHDASGPESSPDREARMARIAHARRLLRKHFTRTERNLLRMHYMTLAPGKDRTYTIKEIADELGYNYSYLRRRHIKTLAKVRRLLAGI